MPINRLFYIDFETIFTGKFRSLTKISTCFLTSWEVGVNLKEGYNGDITARQAGSVGGQMVKKMIEAYENGLK